MSAAMPRLLVPPPDRRLSAPSAVISPDFLRLPVRPPGQTGWCLDRSGAGCVPASPDWPCPGSHDEHRRPGRGDPERGDCLSEDGSGMTGKLVPSQPRIKGAAAKRPCDDQARSRRRLSAFARANSFARRLQTLDGLTPNGFICIIWTTVPEKVTLNPVRQMS